MYGFGTPAKFKVKYMYGTVMGPIHGGVGRTQEPHRQKPGLWNFATSLDKNRPAQLRKLARVLKLQKKKIQV